MGRRKPKTPSPSFAGGGGGASSPAPAKADDRRTSAPPPPPSGDADIKDGYEQALFAFARQDVDKAHKLTADVCRRHRSSPTAHYLHAEISYVVALSLSADPVAKLRYLRGAADSAARAVSLSPSSVELPCLHAEILFQIAVAGGVRFDEVVRVCNRALAVVRPVETLHARIEKVLRDLRFLKQLSCAPSSSEARVKLAAVLGRARIDTMIQSAEEKKKLKTQGERRKAIEVQVAAARLLQLRDSAGDGSPSVEPLPPTSSPAHRLAEGKTMASLKNLTAYVDRKLPVPSYLKSLSITGRQRLLSMSVSDLSAHLSSFDDRREWDGLLHEAVSFAAANATFKFWVCGRCSDKFSDGEALDQHITQEHVGNLSPELQRMLPQEISKEWAEYITETSWDPFDTTEGAPPQRSTDAERIKLVSRVQHMLVMLVKRKNLSHLMLEEIMDTGRQEMGGLPSIPRLPDLEQNRICFMDVPQLRDVLGCLKVISRLLNFGDRPAGLRGHIDQENEAPKRLILESGTSKLLLDSHQFQGDDDVDARPNPIALASWLNDDPSIQEHLSAWTREKEAKSRTSSEIIRMLEKEFNLLHELCEEKCTLLSQVVALDATMKHCVEELKKQKGAGKSVHRRYEAVLKKRQEELTGMESDSMPASSRFELEAITCLLETAQTHGTSSSEADNHIIEMIKNKLVQILLVDARIMRTHRGMQRLELTIGTVSAFDYRTVLLPLVKSFMQMQMLDLVDKDAKEKADAAYEALLKEHEDDAHRNSNKGGDHPKHAQGKSKDKTKNKKNQEKSR